jgi:hypothetical protein
MYGGECPGVYYPRLQRDGWRLAGRIGERSGDGAAIFEKQLPEGWLLRKYAHEEANPGPGKGCYWDEHELEQAGTQRLIRLPEWEWAELDQDTVVWAENGALHRASMNAEGPCGARVLFDFNPMAFEAIEAPY